MKKCDNVRFGDSIVGLNKIEFIKSIIQKLNDIDGEIAEVGVYKGGTAKIIHKQINNKNNLFLFDTFCGIPNKSDFDNHHIIGDFFDSSYESVANLFTDAENVKIFKGIFPIDTGKFITDYKFKFVHLDVDMYESYKDGLNFFYNKMIVGGYIVFDDYNEITCMGATKAVDEFFSDKKEKIRNINKSFFIIKE